MQHYRAANKIIESYESYWVVYLPLMHMALELLIKSVIQHIDSDVDVKKKYLHNTSEIINDYRDQVDLFDTFANDTKAMEFLDGLKEAFLTLRYGNALIQLTDFNDKWNLFKEMVKRLLVKFESISGIRIT